MVRASSLNYRDLTVLKGGGRAPTEIAVVLPFDGAGEVAATSVGVTQVDIGSWIAGFFCCGISWRTLTRRTKELLPSTRTD